VTHAFFKALLFLGAGSVILGMHHEQNTDLMGGLSKRMPWTHRTFLIGVLAIAGLPGFSGFFSKDEILLGANLAHEIPGHSWLWMIGVATAGLTAFYMFRLYCLTFRGECRAPVQIRSHIHEQPKWILIPLFILAIFSALGGLATPPDAYGEVFFNMHESNSLHHFLQEVAGSPRHEISHAQEFGLAGLAVLAAALGAGLAALLYVYRTDLVAKLTRALRPLYGLVFNKYYVDEVYHALIIRPLVRGSDLVLYRTIDAGLIDRVGVDGVAGFVRGVGDRGLKYLQNGLVQSYVFVMLVGGLALVAYLVGGS
jgi:NADH-quinone oxidoreductase subunit L